MQHIKKEVLFIGHYSHNDPILSLARIKQADIWFISSGVRPDTLIKKFFLQTGIASLHLVGQFTDEGFLLANHILKPDDFPVLESGHTDRSMTFWWASNITVGAINQAFMDELQQRTGMSLYTSKMETERGFYRICNKSTPPPAYTSRTVKHLVAIDLDAVATVQESGCIPLHLTRGSPGWDENPSSIRINFVFFLRCLHEKSSTLMIESNGLVL
ncbi:MAG: hypothetical protein RLZZ226_1245 [Pseudomonadota bacterium]